MLYHYKGATRSLATILQGSFERNLSNTPRFSPRRDNLRRQFKTHRIISKLTEILKYKSTKTGKHLQGNYYKLYRITDGLESWRIKWTGKDKLEKLG